MHAVVLSQDACEALRREGQWELDNARGELASCERMGADAEADEQRRMKVRADELLAALQKAKNRVEDGLQEVELSQDVLDWLVERRDGMREYMVDFDRGVSKPDFESFAEAAAVTHVLEYVAESREAVAA